MGSCRCCIPLLQHRRLAEAGRVSAAWRNDGTVVRRSPTYPSKEPCMHARLVKPLRNLVVLLSSFFLLAVG